MKRDSNKLSGFPTEDEGAHRVWQGLVRLCEAPALNLLVVFLLSEHLA